MTSCVTTVSRSASATSWAGSRRPFPEFESYGNGTPWRVRVPRTKRGGETPPSQDTLIHSCKQHVAPERPRHRVDMFNELRHGASLLSLSTRKEEGRRSRRPPSHSYRFPRIARDRLVGGRENSL